MAKKNTSSGPNRAARRSGNPAVRNQDQDKPKAPETAPTKQPTPDKTAENIRVDEDGTWFVKEVNGVEVVLPVFSELSSGHLRRIRGKEQMDGMYSLLEDLCDEEELAATDSLKLGDLQAFFLEWQEASGVSLGE